MKQKLWIGALALAAIAAILLTALPYDGRNAAENPLPPLHTQPAQFAAPEEDPVDLNTAGLRELMTLPEIGEVRAQAILTYRRIYGDFQSVEELAAVEGIGPGILETVRPYVTVGP